ncbi:hypothetical protein BJV74DRAFT_524 [Russula compacta]|nr:hypothetical protein BJV74DRAFT_524 [Russula compacta]
MFKTGAWDEIKRKLQNYFRFRLRFTTSLLAQKDTKDGKWRVTYEVIGNPPNVAVPTHFARSFLHHHLRPPTFRKPLSSQTRRPWRAIVRHFDDTQKIAEMRRVISSSR